MAFLSSICLARNVKEKIYGRLPKYTPRTARCHVAPFERNSNEACFSYFCATIHFPPPHLALQATLKIPIIIIVIIVVQRYRGSSRHLGRLGAPLLLLIIIFHSTIVRYIVCFNKNMFFQRITQASGVVHRFIPWAASLQSVTESQSTLACLPPRKKA